MLRGETEERINFQNCHNESFVKNIFRFELTNECGVRVDFTRFVDNLANLFENFEPMKCKFFKRKGCWGILFGLLNTVHILC